MSAVITINSVSLYFLFETLRPASVVQVQLERSSVHREQVCRWTFATTAWRHVGTRDPSTHSRGANCHDATAERNSASSHGCSSRSTAEFTTWSQPTVSVSCWIFQSNFDFQSLLFYIAFELLFQLSIRWWRLQSGAFSVRWTKIRQSDFTQKSILGMTQQPVSLLKKDSFSGA